MTIKRIAWLALVCLGCRSKPAAVTAERHLAMVRRPGASLFIDRLDNKAILQKADTSGTTTFCSFLIGWRDSLPVTDAGGKQAWQKYFQYTLQQDLVAMLDGDSLRPVFFQEKAGLDPQLKEGAMVFEIPRGRRADTLIFRDGFGAWGTQIFVLNGK